MTDSGEPGDIPANTTIYQLLSRWLFRQGFNDVLLFAILATISYLGYYALTNAIPSHLKIIQEGYDRTAETWREMGDRDRASFEKAIERAYQNCESRHAEPSVKTALSEVVKGAP